MGDYVVFQMSSGQREGLIKAHQFYVEQAKSRLLTQFDNISEEADKAADDWLAERGQQYFDPDRHDPSDLYEGAEDAGIEFYQMLSEMRDRTRLGIIAGFFHEWEKNLRQLLVKEIRLWLHHDWAEKPIWTAKFDRICELLKGCGWPLRSTLWFSDLDACRLVVNVHKHGDGPSLAALKRDYPRFLVHPLAGIGIELDPIWDQLNYEHLRVDDADLEKFAAAITLFWREFPENVLKSQIVAPPDWFVQALKSGAVKEDKMTKSTFSPGGDAKVISQIAKSKFGGFPQMFEHHGWPERGSDMMRKVQTRVVETYGSVRAFEARFAEEMPE